MQGVEVVTSAWKQWGLQALVMFSFTLQVMLLVLAEFRRRTDSFVLRFFVWSAYMLADATAIYVLGHISVTSTSPEQELTAFWAPFLLLHLGGQDNITAYAIEDSQLWLRHLQTLVVQVAAAAYILYESPFMVGSRWSLLRPATILMFSVGVLKYGERVWALKGVGTSSSSSNYRCLDRIAALGLGLSSPASRQHRDTEAFLFKAHVLLDAPMDLLKGPSDFLNVQYGTSVIPGEDMYKVSEMQMSLMHDVLYTKAEVMHTWYGLFIHMVSSLSTLTALLLFHLLGKIHKSRYSRVDMTITYVLLHGAVIMEITSALRAMFSSWTCALLHQRSRERKMWHYLYWIVSSLRRLVSAADWSRYWSGSMGQHNLLQLCARSPASKCSMIARLMGVEDPWNTMIYSSSIPVPQRIKQLLVKRVLESEGILDSSPSHIRNSRGRVALESRGLCDGLLAWSINIELDESIVVWHIVTDLYLCWFKKQAKSSGRQDDTELLDLAKVIEAIEALSNYMIFLLAARPYMLPPPTSRNAYVHVCYSLTSVKCRTPEDLANLVQLSGHELNTRSRSNIEDNDTATSSTGNSSDSSRYKKILDKGSQLGAKLIHEKFEGLGTTEMLDLISQVWVEMLCYISYRCSAHSHAKQLSNGGELITVAAFVMEHIRRRSSEESMEL